MTLESYSVTNETKISVFSTSTQLEVTKLPINSSEDGVRGTHTTKPPNFLLGLQDEALRLDLISLDNSKSDMESILKNNSCEGVVSTKIEFMNLSNFEINKYASTSEPYNCAGGFAIEGYGGLFIKKIRIDFYSRNPKTNHREHYN